MTPPGGNLNPDANTFESKKTSHAVVDANQWEQQQTTATGGEDPSKFSLWVSACIIVAPCNACSNMNDQFWNRGRDLMSNGRLFSAHQQDLFAKVYVYY